MIAVAQWAFRPLPVTHLSAIHLETPDSQPIKDSNTDISLIDERAFTAKLWNPPPVPAVAAAVAKPPEPARPLNVELLGIIFEAGVRKAALYDVDADRLSIVSSGDRFREGHVASINDRSVELNDGRTRRKLILKEAGL